MSFKLVASVEQNELVQNEWAKEASSIQLWKRVALGDKVFFEALREVWVWREITKVCP